MTYPEPGTLGTPDTPPDVEFFAVYPIYVLAPGLRPAMADVVVAMLNEYRDDKRARSGVDDATRAAALSRLANGEGVQRGEIDAAADLLTEFIAVAEDINRGPLVRGREILAEAK